VTLFLRVMAVITALSWLLIGVNVVNDIKRVLEREASEHQRSVQENQTRLEKKP
jgi:uncharacterized membrane protein YuzA (DUF378 family)